MTFDTRDVTFSSYPWCRRNIPDLEKHYPDRECSESRFNCPHCGRPIIMWLQVEVQHPMRRNETAEERKTRIQKRIDDDFFNEEYD